MAEENRKRIHELTLTAVLIASATGLQLLEAPLPRILPWLKPGLANIITLYAIVRLGGVKGIVISVLRTCLAAFVFGSFLSPVHMLSFAGAIASAIVMFLVYCFLPKTSICIISILGAITSNIAQLIAVQFMFAPDMPLWFHLALIIWIGIPSGMIVGKITYELLRRTE